MHRKDSRSKWKTRTLPKDFISETMARQAGGFIGPVWTAQTRSSCTPKTTSYLQLPAEFIFPVLQLLNIWESCPMEMSGSALPIRPRSFMSMVEFSLKTEGITASELHQHPIRM